MRARKCPGPGGSWASIPYETAQPSQVCQGEGTSLSLHFLMGRVAYLPTLPADRRDTLLKASSRVFAHRQCSLNKWWFLSLPLPPANP